MAHMTELLPEIGGAVKRNWVFISSAFVGMYYATRWVIYTSIDRVLHDRVTHDQLNKCKEDVTTLFADELQKHADVEFHRLDNLRDEARTSIHEFSKRNERSHIEMVHMIERIEDKVTLLMTKLMDKT